jgi:hypothetical protein
MRNKAPRDGLNGEDEVSLAPYLTPAAISYLRGIKTAKSLAAQAGAVDSGNPSAGSAAYSRLSGLGAGPSGSLDADRLSKIYDGQTTPAGNPADAAVRLSGSAGTRPGQRTITAARPLRKAPPPPETRLTEEFSGMPGYSDIKKENDYVKVMKEVDKDGEDAAAKGRKIKAAGYAALNSVYSVSRDFDETFIHNPAPKDEDVQRVINRIKSSAKNPDEAWQIAYTMRQKRDFPALRDAEHYLWACSEANESRWHAARTLITTPMYSAAKLPGLRKIFFDENTSPPSLSEIKWGWKGVKDCAK